MWHVVIVWAQRANGQWVNVKQRMTQQGQDASWEYQMNQMYMRSPDMMRSLAQYQGVRDVIQGVHTWHIWDPATQWWRENPGTRQSINLRSSPTGTQPVPDHTY